MSSSTLAGTIRELYDITSQLEKEYGRPFTPDGHLVGSLGEVWAEEHYGLHLFDPSFPVHDAVTKDGTKRLVQIKATQRERVALSGRPDYLIVLHISREGEFEEVYNGPGEPTWKRGDDSGRQYQVSLSRLRRLNAQVADEDRIQAAQ